MKANRLICVCLLLMLGVAGAQQTNSLLTATNSVAIEELLAKAEKGDVAAQKQIADFYYSGRGLPKDWSQSLKWRRKAAEQGDAESQFTLGAYYETGDWGVKQDFAEAAKWYQEAARNGNKFAELFLAQMYREGRGVTNDLAEAAKWYRRGAEQGFSACQCGLGHCYYSGDGVKQDYSEAAKWFLKAAEQGDIEAQFKLGGMYRKGQGVMQDYVESVKWWREAAEQGYSIAQFGVGSAYEDGKGVARNYTEAAKWYSRAAEQGEISAQVRLGAFYEEGKGVPKNNVESYKWFNLASAHSATDETDRELIESSARLRDGLVKVEEMTSEEVAEAQRRSAAFVPRKEVHSSSSNSGSPIAVDSPIATGTGFFITDDGYLISNYHVVKDTAKVRVVTGAGLIDAKVVKVDAANDLALLKAEGRFAPLPVAASRGVKLGGTVATVGFPNIGMQGFSPKLAKGEIASLSGAADDARYFQISVPVQPGDSGGALVDEHGNVVGVVSAKLDAVAALKTSGSLPENVNYAVKSSFLLSFLESVPAVSAKLKEPVTADRKFEDVVKSAQDAAVLVLVY